MLPRKKEHIPASLIQDCPIPRVYVEVNGDFPRVVESLKGALRECNVDKAALRKWDQGL